MKDGQVVQNIECRKGHKFSIDDRALTQIAQLSRRIRTAAQKTVEQDNAKGKSTNLFGDAFIRALDL
jgi:hypothetical protein